jgi:phosphoribosyl 1,2-cyclic phosphodiesterase/CheY-like chemotaxis protein
MDKGLKVFIVDDDPDFIKLLRKYLETEAAKVGYSTSSVDAPPKIIKEAPDCLILDIMMPGLDGLELCKLLRRERSLDAMKIVIVSGKSYQFDRERAFSFGADGYIVKPVNLREFGAQLRQILEEKIGLTFWGIRGTLPVPGEGALKYGGNTSCVTLEFPRENLFIFDAGTGIKVFSDHLMAKQERRIEAEIFISHPHWDHINALPFFRPLYQRGNEFEILGSAQGDTSLSELISAQMDGVYFPIRFKEFGAHVRFTELGEQDVRVDGIQVRTLFLSHPGTCLGFRVDYNGRSVCYVTDNELYPEDTRFHDRRYVERLTAFVSGTDMLITDTTYDDADYPERMHWGHSSVGQVAKVASAARVRTWCLFHHDPDQSDNDIDAKVSAARKALERLGSDVMAIAPAEGQSFKI